MHKGLKYIIILCLLFYVSSLSAQTRYYKQLKIITKDNIEKRGDGSGQFITINDKTCYDSDRKGHTVNNGFAKFGKDTGERVYYSGTSYWGNATYIFTENYGRVNIRIADGTTYVYVVANAPHNILTSSLIKESETTKKGETPNFIPMIIDNRDYSIDLQTKTKELRLKRKKCNFCNGSKINPGRNYAPNYTGKSQLRYCSTCGGNYELHSHDKCPSCNGKGYTETYN